MQVGNRLCHAPPVQTAESIYAHRGQSARESTSSCQCHSIVLCGQLPLSGSPGRLRVPTRRNLDPRLRFGRVLGCRIQTSLHSRYAILESRCSHGYAEFPVGYRRGSPPLKIQRRGLLVRSKIPRRYLRLALSVVLRPAVPPRATWYEGISRTHVPNTKPQHGTEITRY